MNILLLQHPQKYNFSKIDFLLTSATLSGGPFAMRHFALWKKDKQLTHLALAVAEWIPVAGFIVALAERIIANLTTTPQKPKEKINPNTRHSMPPSSLTPFFYELENRQNQTPLLVRVPSPILNTNLEKVTQQLVEYQWNDLIPLLKSTDKGQLVQNLCNKFQNLSKENEGKDLFQQYQLIGEILDTYITEVDLTNLKIRKAGDFTSFPNQVNQKIQESKLLHGKISPPQKRRKTVEMLNITIPESVQLIEQENQATKKGQFYFLRDLTATIVDGESRLRCALLHNGHKQVYYYTETGFLDENGEATLCDTLEELIVEWPSQEKTPTVVDPAQKKDFENKLRNLIQRLQREKKIDTRIKVLSALGSLKEHWAFICPGDTPNSFGFFYSPLSDQSNQISSGSSSWYTLDERNCVTTLQKTKTWPSMEAFLQEITKDLPKPAQQHTRRKTAD